jgi:Lon-like protease
MMKIERRDSQDDAPLAAPVRSFRWRWMLFVTVLAGLVYAAFYVPLPFFYAYLPGPVRDVERLVKVTDARTYSSEGSLYLTTVSVDTQVTFADWVEALFDDRRMIVERDQVTGGSSFEELEHEQKLEMDQSQQQAREVALVALGYEAPEGDGVRIVQTADDSPADAVLKADDVIVSVDGHKVATDCDASEIISARAPGDRLAITLRRHGHSEHVTLTTAPFPGDPSRAYVGVFMETVDYKFDPGLDVEFETGRIAGPSAGLMFSLGLYDQLTPEDLTHGQEIAGTGTIECGGRVGPIGGIQQKVAAAEREGAVIFLAPAANAAQARAVADDIEIIPIETFDDARNYLENL